MFQYRVASLFILSIAALAGAQPAKPSAAGLIVARATCESKPYAASMDDLRSYGVSDSNIPDRATYDRTLQQTECLRLTYRSGGFNVIALVEKPKRLVNVYLSRDCDASWRYRHVWDAAARSALYTPATGLAGIHSDCAAVSRNRRRRRPRRVWRR